MLALESIETIESQIFAIISKFVPEGYRLNFSFTKEDKVLNDFDLADLIRREICNYFDISINDLSKKSRETQLVIARKFVCLFLRERTVLNLKEIATYAGYRCEDDKKHSNAIHCLNSLKDWLHTDEKIKNHYKQITENLTFKNIK